MPLYSRPVYLAFQRFDIRSRHWDDFSRPHALHQCECTRRFWADRTAGQDYGDCGVGDLTARLEAVLQTKRAVACVQGSKRPLLHHGTPALVKFGGQHPRLTTDDRPVHADPASISCCTGAALLQALLPRLDHLSFRPSRCPRAAAPDPALTSQLLPAALA